jgi:hypothetical protein
MHKIDMRSETTIAHGILATLSGTTPAAGNIVDVADYQSATFALITGVVADAGAAAGITFVVQESDTTAASGFAAVADADLLGSEAGLAITLDSLDGVAIGTIGYRGSKRYLRVVATGTADTDATIAGVWVLQKPRYSPKGNAAANIAAT